MFKKKIEADVGEYVKARTRRGEVNGVLVPFRGRKMLQTRLGIEDVELVTAVTPTQSLGEDTRHFLRAVRRRHGWL
jgi:hypothetical protein